jgi:hypothetical protein
MTRFEEAAIASILIMTPVVIWFYWPQIRRWVVNHFPAAEPPTDGPYVNQPAQQGATPTAFPVSHATEPEPERETEASRNIAVGPDTVVIAREKLDKLLDQEAEAGMAYAFGLLLGGGFLDTVVAAKRLTEAKQLVFPNRSGRQMTERINPVIRQGEQDAGTRRPVAPKEVRTVTVNNERELLLD